MNHKLTDTAARRSSRESFPSPAQVILSRGYRDLIAHYRHIHTNNTNCVRYRSRDPLRRSIFSSFFPVKSLSYTHTLSQLVTAGVLFKSTLLYPLR